MARKLAKTPSEYVQVPEYLKKKGYKITNKLKIDLKVESIGDGNNEMWERNWETKYKIRFYRRHEKPQ